VRYKLWRAVSTSGIREWSVGYLAGAVGGIDFCGGDAALQRTFWWWMVFLVVCDGAGGKGKRGCRCVPAFGVRALCRGTKDTCGEKGGAQLQSPPDKTTATHSTARYHNQAVHEHRCRPGAKMGDSRQLINQCTMVDHSASFNESGLDMDGNVAIHVVSKHM
jgi:hypothetical protein